MKAIALSCAAWLLAVAAVAAQAPPVPRIWQGVYTAAQAQRGKSSYDTSCVRCHGADLAGTTAPALKGDRFMDTWGGENLSRLFEKIRDTMPPLFGTFVSDDAKLDIVGYILQANGYPAGKTDLVAAELGSIQILGKGQSTAVQNFALVQVVGCLARREGGWRLTRMGTPATTTANTPSDDALKQAAGRPLGDGDYLLLSAPPFAPESLQGQKVEARGLIYTETGNGRLTLTSLTSVGPCS